MPWLFVLLAGIFEMSWVVALRYSQGFTRLWPSLIVVLAMLLSLLMAAQAARSLPIGTVYAMWTGIGAIGVVSVGILAFNEPGEPLRLLCIGLIIAGIVGLRAVSTA